jgi:hypothetical protein
MADTDRAKRFNEEAPEEAMDVVPATEEELEARRAAGNQTTTTEEVDSDEED